jgi:hypothetical protein
MSRSNPTSDVVHPCQLWLEWDAKTGTVVYYDKKSDSNVSMPKKFVFVVLDQLNLVTGYDRKNKCGITSNEVRKSVEEVMAVKSFKGSHIKSGLYSEIKDTITARGGKFTRNIYIMCKRDGKPVLASLKIHGTTLRAWSEFFNANREEVKNTKAVIINGTFTEQVDGKDFIFPVFGLYELSEAGNDAAKAMDRVLQSYLDIYLAKKSGEPAPQQQSTKSSVVDDDNPVDQEPEPAPEEAAEENTDDVPF